MGMPTPPKKGVERISEGRTQLEKGFRVGHVLAVNSGSKGTIATHTECGDFEPVLGSP